MGSVLTAKAGRFITNLRNNLRYYSDIPEIVFDDGRKTVLIMISSLARGGAQRVACRLASGLADNFNIILMYRQERENCYDVDPRVRVVKLPRFRYDLFCGFSVIWLRQFKKKSRIDLTLSLLYSMNRRNLLSKRKDRVVVCERNNPPIAFPDEFASTKRVYALADHVVFQTREVQSLYGKRTREHSTILPNPVSVSCLASEVRTPRIVNAARLHKNKNQEMLIKAFSIFRETHPEYILDIYGEGPLKEELEEAVKRYGVEGSVVLRGNVPDIHERIADAGMMVLSSNVEGMPNSLLEGLMMGLPCVSTACTGAKEVIRDGWNGLLTPVGDAEALAGAMARMADEPELAESCRKNAMNSVDIFRQENAMKLWIEFIEEQAGIGGYRTGKSLEKRRAQ